LRRGGEEKEQRRVLGGSTPTPLCTRGLVGRKNAKPGVTLRTNSQRGVSPADERARPCPSAGRLRGVARYFRGVSGGFREGFLCSLDSRPQPSRASFRSKLCLLIPLITAAVPGRAIPCSAAPQQRHKIVQNRLALVGEESVSGVTAEPPPGQTGTPTHAHLYHRQ
jgi:hypothetical protein